MIFKSHETISCNTHYARFRWEDGYCESGDCIGEPLVSVPLHIDGDTVLLA